MLVSSVTCQVVPCGRHPASFTVNASDPPWTVSWPVGSLLSGIRVQPVASSNSQRGRFCPPDPPLLPLPPPDPQTAQPATPSPITTTPASAANSQRRRRLVTTTGSPRSER